MTRVLDININTAAYWDEVHAREVPGGRVDAIRLGQLERWVGVREREVQRFARVLDFGCGQGDALFALWEMRRDRVLFGVDISPVAIDAARDVRYGLGAHDVDLRVAELGVVAKIAEVRKGLDIVWCGETLEHVDDPAGLIQQFAQVAGGGAFIVLSTPYRRRNTSPEHVHEFTPADVTRWAELVGELVFLDCLLLPRWLTMFAVLRVGVGS